MSTLDTVALAAQKYYPMPNTPGTANPAFPGVVINNYAYTSPNLNPFHKWFGRIDYDQSEKNRINFSITQGDNPGTNTNFQICPIDCFSGDVDQVQYAGFRCVFNQRARGERSPVRLYQAR